jgi:hypothetical protein
MYSILYVFPYKMYDIPYNAGPGKPMSTPSHGARFILHGQHIVLLIREARSVAIVPPRETPQPVRLEILAPDGTLRGTADYASLEDLIDGRWVDSDELLP